MITASKRPSRSDCSAAAGVTAMLAFAPHARSCRAISGPSTGPGATISAADPAKSQDGSAAASAASAGGNAIVQVKVAPCPGVLSRLISPPIASTRRFEIASPRPVPPNRRPAPASACSNSSKIRACISGAMPMPVSRMRNAKAPSRAGVTATATPPVCVNLIALPMRLSRTWRTRVASPTKRCAAASSTNAAISMPLAWARGANSSTTSSTSGRNANGLMSRSSRPASILEKSRMSSIRQASASPDGFHRLGIGRLLRRERGVQQQIGHAENAVERRADFMGDHGEKAAPRPAGGIGLPPFPFPVGKGFDAFFEQVDAAAAGAVDPVEGEAQACRDQRQRAEGEIKCVTIHSRIPPPAAGEGAPSWRVVTANMAQRACQSLHSGPPIAPLVAQRLTRG
jgi:hypothetical protein